MLVAEVVEAALERLEMRIGVAVIVEPDLVEVPEPAADREVAPPIVRIALERHALARIDLADDIGAAAERRLERGFLEGLGLDRVLGEHRHQPEDQRQLAVVAAGKIEAHRAFADHLGLGDLGVIGAMVGPAFVAQQLPGEDHVVGRDRLAVRETRGGVEREGDVAALGVGLDRAGDQPVERERLVVAARHQALDHVAADGPQREPLDDQGIEAVEGAEHAVHQAAALGRGRIGVAAHG